MKWYKRFALLLSSLVFLLLPILQPLNSYASESTTSGSDSWSMPAETFLQLTFDGFSKQISAPYVVYNEFQNMGYDGFRLWCENGDHWQVIEDGTVTGHGGAGYSRPSDKIDNAENIEVPTDIKNLVLNYIQYNVTQNPLPYKECYIYSYGMVNATDFPTYEMYASFKAWAQQQDGYILPYFAYQSGQINSLRCVMIPKTNAVNFVGTTTQGGFTTVSLYIGWSTATRPWTLTSNWKHFNITKNGTISEVTNEPSACNTVGNTSSIINGVNSRMTIFTNLPKNELVYVFPTLNALKNYNAGSPQPYYLTSTGANTGTWTASGGGVINTGTMNNSGNYYNQVTNGIGSNWTPQQIITLVDTVVNGSGGSGGSGGTGSSDNPFGFLGKLGEIIGQLVGGVGDLLTGIVDGIANVFLGTPDDNGVRQGGLFSVVRGVINGLVELIDTDFVEFFNVVFDWLPQEIITLMIAGLTFALFFGILKMIRG